IAASAAEENKSIYDSLIDMYLEFGMYRERLITLTRTGREGEQAIRTMMENFRSRAPEQIAGQRVVRALDYKTGVEVNLESGKKSKIELPVSDVLQFYLEDGSKISVRPSGTEPKIKFYFSVNTTLSSADEYEQTSREVEERIDKIEAALMGERPGRDRCRCRSRGRAEAGGEGEESGKGTAGADYMKKWVK